MAVVWHQVVFALDAKYNALRAKNNPNFRTLYIRRRNQLLLEFGTCKEHGFWKEYLKIRGLILQNRYGLAIDQISLRRQSINWASSDNATSLQECDDKFSITKDDILTPTKEAEASRAIVGNSSISENYAFAGVHHIFDQHTAAVTMVKFANNDRARLCCVSNDSTVSICNVLTQPPTLECILRGHTLAVTGCDWSASNDMLVTSSLDGQICLWSATNGVCIRAVRDIVPSQLFSCIFNPVNNNFVVAGNSKGQVEVLNISTGKKNSNVMGGRVLSLAFDSTGSLLWAGNDEGVIMSFLFDIKSGKMTKRRRMYLGNNASITSINYRAWISRESRDPSLLINISANSVRVYRVIEKDGSLSLRRSFFVKHQNNNFIHSSFCPIMSFRQGACIVTGSEDSCVYFIDIECDKENKRAIINKLQGHSSPVLGVSFNYDESLLSTSDQQGLVIVWTRSSNVQS
ncbi:WD repeat-containing protein 13 [Halyomorpha halys]|uniref:WD repeat-containing protein 13 n=1 Tax=Halyomorpha halys TaxID=286706 RepID=UPI0006D4ED36|nr:WD repeat-containing protein 13 [Halyomorpha halys]